MVTNPGRIRVRLKVERARARKEQPSRSGTAKIPKNMKKVGVVELGGRRDKLTQYMDSVRDVRTSDPKIDKATNKMTIASRISKRFTIRGAQVNTQLHGCINSMVICESGTGEKILDILLLGEVDAVRRGRDLKTKKVMKRTKIRHQELITEAHLHKVNELRVITSDDHVINIEKKKRATTR